MHFCVQKIRLYKECVKAISSVCMNVWRCKNTLQFTFCTWYKEKENGDISIKNKRM